MSTTASFSRICFRHQTEKSRNNAEKWLTGIEATWKNSFKDLSVNASYKSYTNWKERFSSLYAGNFFSGCHFEIVQDKCLRNLVITETIWKWQNIWVLTLHSTYLTLTVMIAIITVEHSYGAYSWDR